MHSAIRDTVARRRLPVRSGVIFPVGRLVAAMSRKWRPGFAGSSRRSTSPKAFAGVQRILPRRGVARSQQNN